MGTPYIAEIRLFSFNFPPRGWAFCNGQVLPINQNQALFALLGTTYGGNGQTTFQLPNLQARVPIHFGSGGGSYTLGQVGGESAHTLSVPEMPQHGHTANGSSAAPDRGTAAGNYWAAGPGEYASAADTTMSGSAIGATGGTQPHENFPPYSVIVFCIALTGIFPSPN